MLCECRNTSGCEGSVCVSVGKDAGTDSEAVRVLC